MRIRRFEAAAIFFCLVSFCLAGPVLGNACDWTGASSTNWAASGNWSSCGGTTPQSGDTATVSSGGNQPDIQAATTVTLAGLTINSGATVTVDGTLNIGGEDGSGTLAVNGALNWTGGEIAGTVVIASGGTMTIANGGAAALSGTVTVNGTANWTSGRIDFHAAGTFNNNGTFTTTTDNNCENFGTTPAFNNAGTLTKSTATGTSTFNVPFNNTGTVTASTGTVALSAGGTSTGSFSASSGATLNFGGGTHSVTLAAAKSIGGAGTIGYTGGTTTVGGSGTYSLTGTSNLAGSTLNLNISSGAGSWTHSSGTLAGSATVTVPTGKSYGWTGGEIAGTVVIASGGTLTIANGGAAALSGTVTVNGTANWTSGRIDFHAAGTFNNNGTFTITTDNNCENFGTTPAFNNAGTLTKSTAIGTSTFNVPFNNTGTVTASTGTVTLNAGGTSTGSFSASSGATLNFGGGTHSVTLAAAKSIGGAGTIGYTGGTTTVGGSGTYSLTGTSNLAGGTLNLNISSGAGSWTHSSGTLAGSATATVPSGKSYGWTGGEIAGTVVIASGGTMTIANGGAAALSGTVTVNGTANWTSGRIDFHAAGTFNNNGTFTTTTDNNCENFGTTPAFNNAGTLTKSTATGTSTFNVPFNNTGTVTASTGTVTLNAGGTSTGSFSASSGAALNFGGGTHSVTLAAAKSIGGAGTIGYTGGTTTVGGSGTYSLTGTSNLAGGTLNLNIPSGAGSWTQSAGTLAGSATATVPTGKSYGWTGGEIASTVVIASGGTLTIANGGAAALSGTVTVNGTANWTSGRIDFHGSGTLNNNGTFTTTTDNNCENFGTTPAFNNAGTLTKSTAIGTSTFNVPFNNTGTVTASTGTVTLNAGGTSTGSFSASSGAALNFGGGTHSVALAAAKSIGGAGTIGYTGGTTTVGGSGTYNLTGTSNLAGGTLNLNIPSGAGSWTQSAGTLAGSATATVPTGKSYGWTGGEIAGTVVIASGGTLTIANGGAAALSGTVTVNGTANWTSGRIDFHAAGTFNNNGTFTITTDNNCENFGTTPAFNNAGTLTKSTAIGTSTFNVPFNNTGTVNALSGTLGLNAFTQTAGFTILNGGNLSTNGALAIQGGTLKGNGIITGNVNNGGTVAPGLSPGILNVVGNYSQTAAGKLAVELNGATVGTQYDQLNVTGTIALAGTLSVTTGFPPPDGTQFLITNNDATDAILGSFTGLAEGAVIVAAPGTFRITYGGGSGNDVVLTAGPADAGVALAVDPAAGAGSDGNGVFEPGETVTIKPSWKNLGTNPVPFAATASDFTGPAGPSYTIPDDAADYGSIAANETADCGSNCYSLFVTDPASRPSTHWDSHFTETPGTADPPKVWTVHLGDSFTDVPRSQPFYKRIETLVHTGITAGCGVGIYCPNDAVARDQMGIFIAKGIAGGGPNVPVSGSVNGNPYNCVNGGVSVFTDVKPTDIFCKHVHYMAIQNVTLGCAANLYCPSASIARSDMAIFIAKALVAPNGGPAVPVTYGPDPVTGLSYSCNPGSPSLHFTDIAPSDNFCKHVHFLWAKGVITGCSGTLYCPTQGVTRDAMAKFLGNAFNLVLYGP